jgi:DNA modification methylase
MAETADPTTVAGLVPDPKNRRKHPARNVDLIAAALRNVGAARSIVIDEANEVLAGNGVLEGAAAAGISKLQIVEADGETIVAVRRRGLSPEQKRDLALYDNRTSELAEWNLDQLAIDAAEGALAPFFFEDEIAALLGGAEGGSGGPVRVSLADRFGVPPFSVLDARQGYWQARKAAWLALGIESEIGREGMPGGVANATGKNSAMNKLSGRLARDKDDDSPVVSIFDPVLCELAYRWFCPSGGLVLDPFAGGSVRGLVAAKLGRRYLGVDLRAEQLAANEGQADRICAEGLRPTWRCGDARQIEALAGRADADFVFSCPPYGNLEIYSEDPADISTLDYPAFREAYRAIVAAALRVLKPDRFACFVVGDLRDKRGFYRRFVSDTEQAFEDGGAHFYNEAVLVTALGSLPLRAARAFESGRKLAKTHQNVLVFCKGDPKKATEACGPVEVQWTITEATPFGERTTAAAPVLGGEIA